MTGSEPWMAWMVAGDGRTVDSSAGEGEGDGGVRRESGPPKNLVFFPFPKIKALVPNWVKSKIRAKKKKKGNLTYIKVFPIC